MERLNLNVEAGLHANSSKTQRSFSIRKAICAGFFKNACRKDQQEGYRQVSDNKQVFIHPSSSLFDHSPEWVIYHDLVMTTKEYMREVLHVDPKWLMEVAPNFFK
mmetsp:Transcript_34694/g.53203  ORF Transcript_34694/g.53203 Transcript_34694/m.53203 type:complete len:105 (-) Transcript_34694:200-514(-)